MIFIISAVFLFNKKYKSDFLTKDTLHKSVENLKIQHYTVNMGEKWHSFIPSDKGTYSLPLGRFLPPLKEGMVKNWLKTRIPKGGWLIDPFCSNPALSLEAAHAGYRVLVTCNNPVLSFMLEVLAEAPNRSEFLAALSDLGSVMRGEERFEHYLGSRYRTNCELCGSNIQTQAFVWRRDDKTPSAKIYHCPNCGDQGERKLSEQDLTNLQLGGKDALHRSRATERIRLGPGPIEPAAQEAIQAYLPRPLDFLFTFINKIEGLNITPNRKKLLTALALSACDEGSALWAWPNVRNRPKQLGIPPQFRENNLWLAIENAIEDWTLFKDPIPLTVWPVLPPNHTGGISLLRGRINSLDQIPEGVKPYAAISSIPRPNQAFWTLCAVWTGWIWGKEAAMPLRKALERRRYDWYWHTSALYTTFSHLHKLVPQDFPFFGILNEIVPGFLSSTINASEMAGFHLETSALMDDEDTYQFFSNARPSEGTIKGVTDPIESILIKSFSKTLRDQNQPASSTTLMAAGLAELSQSEWFSSENPNREQDSLIKIQQTYEKLLSESPLLHHHGGKGQSIEGGTWWFQDPSCKSNLLALSDRVEIRIIEHLESHSPSSFTEINNALFQEFQGLETPSSNLILACLESYADQDTNGGGWWQLRSTEYTIRRKEDLKNISNILVNLSKNLGYTVKEGENLEWINENGGSAFSFFIKATSMITPILQTTTQQQGIHNVFVFPGSRSNLLAYKFLIDPRLEQASQTNWHFLKFRNLRRIIERENLKPDQFLDLLKQDPPVWDEPKQMTFF